MYFLLLQVVWLLRLRNADGAVPTSPIFNFIVDNLNCGCNRADNLDISKTKVSVYNFETNSNNSYPISNAAESILNQKDFDPNQCIHIFIPGLFTTNVQDAICIFSKIVCNDTNGSNSTKALAIIIDHSPYTKGNIIDNVLLVIQTYQRAVKYTKSIGVAVGKLLVKLLDKVNRDHIDIMGHSLGGHMSGYAGGVVIQDTGKPLKSIYATDPAGPCFANCMSEHVKSGNADLVVSMHCNAGQLGSNLNLADYDFYAGNGVIQLGCGEGSYELFLNYFETSCSHLRCVSIMGIPAVNKRIWNSVKCSSPEAYQSGKCGNQETVLGGYTIVPQGSPGVYYFSPPVKATCELPNPLSVT